MTNRVLFFITIVTFASSLGCDYKKPEEISSSPIKVDNDYSINKLDKKTIPEIVGLWKLYKEETQEGKSNISSGNYYLNIKGDDTYESNSEKGNWFLSYNNNKGQLQTFIIFRPNRENLYYYSESITIRKVSMSIENNTTFFRLSDLDNKTAKILIHQN